jgi:enolase-phosphatase E1
MGTTRSSRKRSPSPTTAVSQEPPAKALKTPEKPKSSAAASNATTEQQSVPENSTKSLAPTAKKQSLSGITTLLLDIEGTICPITFVKATLFPYFLEALPSHLEANWSFPTLAPYISAFPPEHATDKETLVTHVRDLVERDVKAPYLKALQGHLWEDGYRTGKYAAPVYEDVLRGLDSWPAGQGGSEEAKGKGRQVAIYSSGSVPAQKLFMEHIKDPATPKGEMGTVFDKRSQISAWFDTVNAGPKQESASYTTIAKELEKKPEEVLFLSDNVAEVRAAIQAGMKSILVEREGNAPLSDDDREEFKSKSIETFDELDLV